MEVYIPGIHESCMDYRLFVDLGFDRVGADQTDSGD